jgi:hypothetical protein
MGWESLRKGFEGSRYFQGCISNGFGDRNLARKIGVAHAVACAANTKLGKLVKKHSFNKFM